MFRPDQSPTKYAPNMPTAVLVFANLLLISRVWALWERNKFVLGGML